MQIEEIEARQTQSVRRRIQMLEGLPQFQPPPGPLEPINRLALRQMSDEDLELMITMTRDRDAGVCRTIRGALSAKGSGEEGRVTSRLFRDG
jgi:hypothetical protein